MKNQLPTAVRLQITRSNTEDGNGPREHWAYRARGPLISAFFLGSLIADLWGLGVGLDLKLFWAFLSVAITLTGYAIYISQMYPKRSEPPVKPEPLSWVFFGFLTATGALVQIKQNGGAGSWCLIITAAGCFVIAGWSYWKWRSEWYFDSLHKGVALGSIALFAVSLVMAKSPRLAVLSAVSATLADFVSYFPTFRKGFLRPHEDSSTNFAFNSAKCIPALLALQSYSIATTVYLIMLTIVNGGFAMFLLVRRRPRIPTSILLFMGLAFLQFVVLVGTLVCPDLITSAIQHINIDWNIKKFEPLAQIGFLIGSVTFLIAEYHFASAHNRLVSIAESVTSRCIQDFPDHIDRIAELVSQAKRQVIILADCVDYGSFRDFDRHEKLLSAICEKRQAIDDIDFLIWDNPEPMSRANKYRDADTRAQDVRNFRECVSVFLSKLAQHDVIFAKRCATEIASLSRSANDAESKWTDPKVAPMTSLLALQGSFHNLQLDRLKAADVYPTIFKPKRRARRDEEQISPIDEQEPTPPELFFWIIDNYIAIFILPFQGEDTIAFKTEDQHLIKRLVQIFQWRVKWANEHPDQSG